MSNSWNTVTFGAYPQTAKGTDKSPIEWIVLARDGQNALLLSKYGLDAEPYNTEYANVTWETCTLRSWLNSDFLNRAFTSSEQKAILTTNVDNSKSQGYWSTSGGNNTQDRVFLLSYQEANTYLDVRDEEEDGAEDNMTSRTSPTAYAKAQGAGTSSSDHTSEGAAAGWWWFRSPGSLRSSAAFVYGDGSLIYSSVSDDDVCVRPALWVNLGAIATSTNSPLLKRRINVFVSTPMRGRTETEIKESIQRGFNYARDLYIGDDVQLINSYDPDLNAVVNPVIMLGRSIEKLGYADVCVFMEGWEDARGCNIEHAVCNQYNIPIL